jgi:hypothetical protein
VTRTPRKHWGKSATGQPMKLHTLGRILEFGPGVDRERAALELLRRLLDVDVTRWLLYQCGALRPIEGLVEAKVRAGETEEYER